MSPDSISKNTGCFFFKTQNYIGLDSSPNLQAYFISPQSYTGILMTSHMARDNQITKHPGGNNIEFIFVSHFGL